jgi:hypothetical protein
MDGLSRPSTSSLQNMVFAWMAGTSPAKTVGLLEN